MSARLHNNDHRPAHDDLLTAAFATTSDGIVIVDARHCAARMNRAAERLTGWSDELARGRHWAEIVNFAPDAMCAGGALGGPPTIGAYRVELETRAAGSVTVVARFERIQGEPPATSLGTVITLRQHDAVAALQSALDRTEQRLHIALDRGQVGMWEWNAATDTLHEYGAWVGRTVHTADSPSTSGNWLMENTHPDDVPVVRAALFAHLRGEREHYEVEQRVRLVGGGYVRFLVRGQTVERDQHGHSTRLIGTYTDVTALRVQEQLLHFALQSSQQGVWEWEPEVDRIHFSPEWYAMLGYREGSIRDARIDLAPIVHPDDARAAARSIAPMLAGAEDDFQLEQRFRHRDGHYVHMLSRGCVLERGPDGRALRVLGTQVDITALKQTEARLIESGRLLEAVIDAFPQRLFWKDLDNRYLGANQLFVRDAGLAGVDELVGKHTRDLGWPESVDDFIEDDKRLLSGAESRLTVERRFEPIAGDAFWCETTKVALRAPDGSVAGILGMYDDVSARRLRQQQLEIVANALTSGRQKRLLNGLTRAAAELARADHAFVARLDGDGSATITACYPSRKPLKGNTYQVAGTPCALTVNRSHCFIPRNVRQQFPQAELLSHLNVDGFAGQILRTAEGELIGVFALMFTSPPPAEANVRTVLDIFAARATAELDRERTHSELLASERRLNAAIESGNQGIWEWELSSDQLLTFGVHFFRALGYTDAPDTMTGALLAERIHPDDRPGMRAALRAYFRGERDTYEGEVRMRAFDGNYHWTLIRGEAWDRDGDGRITRMVGTHTDISAVKEVQSALERSQDFLELIIDTVPQAIFWQDREFRYLGCNQRFAEVAGVATPQELIGKTDAELWWASQCASFQAEDRPLLSGALPFLQTEMRLTDGRGEKRWTELVKVPMRNGAGEIIGLLGAIHDVSVRKAAEARAQHLALYDPLTNLPNRRYFSERLESSLAQSERHGTTGALLFIDMDQFKRINDTLGHSIGDSLLQAVAERLQNVTRQEDMVARLGGDEFVLLLPDLARDFEMCARQARVVADKIHESLAHPFQFEHHQFHVTPTIGISLFPEPGKGVDDVLKEADTAMYSGKAAGRNVTRFFRREMEESAQQRLRIESDLRKALAQDEFELYFQPQVDASGGVTGAEVLLRWHHPEQGMIPPSLFIPVAEERGLIVDIGRLVMSSAFATFKSWLDAADVDVGELSVNVSSRQFRSDDFVLDVERLLAEHRIPAHRVVLELTEGTVIEDVNATIAIMERLRRLGIKFAVDDFGVGYSSLSYLKRLPIDQLKIDRSFIADIGRDQNDEVICQTIIAMGQHLGLQTVAEGVETVEQFEFLRRLRCNRYQGYYFMKPAPGAEFIRFCASADGR